MASVLGEEVARFFPLRSGQDVVELFRHQLFRTPDLTMLSIVTGIIENTLTRGRGVDVSGVTTASGCVEELSNFPAIEQVDVEVLYKKFRTILATVEGKPAGRTVRREYATRDVIKKVSDVIWNSLIRSSYKDRAHLQSLYSYLAHNKLDCFGVAFAVVAGCQMLGYSDVHLAISEDHAWVVFGRTQDETIEVTWHGKGFEDKRGQPVSAGVESQSWLYLCGHPVVCTRHMEVVALVLAINPSLSITSACLEVTELQQQLLWLLYDMGHMEKYPMGLGSLGELEEMCQTDKRPASEELYEESVRSARTYYKNYHVYPYTYQGGYYYRKNLYKNAFASWANAGDVIRLYIYSRDDEEIYKELLDIANEQIPLIMKTESSGHSAHSILRDPQCFANLLRFYDGICQWEEGSLTPILHIGWAKPLVNTISKFDYDIRSQVTINCASDDDDVQSSISIVNRKEATKHHTLEESVEEKRRRDGMNNNIVIAGKDDKGGGGGDAVKGCRENGSEDVTKLPPTLEALTAACGEKILNPDFLLQGGGQPFTESQQTPPNETPPKGLPKGGAPEEVKVEPPPKVEAKKEEKVEGKGDKVDGDGAIIETEVKSSSEAVKSDGPKFEPKDDEEDLRPKRPVITLYSHKMKGLKDLLLAEKLNTHAISLQVTAQSQVGGKKGRSGMFSSGQGGSNLIHSVSLGSSSFDSDLGGSSRPKRSRHIFLLQPLLFFW
ncbi:menin isoform X2 [Phlebotomus papatasi]|uniref:menin isoform X2 n=1 Tax=Phlebotomus papatasi TaxID=29031 RepID=UPI002483BC83|nr:menin isoform X2 [Phlebotomus papatasi]